MTELRPPILIGDIVPARAEWLSQFLIDYYNAASTQIADTFDKIRNLARQQLPGTVIFLADTLPFSYDIPEVTPNKNLDQLDGIDPMAQLVCVVTGAESPTPEGRRNVCYIRLPSAEPTGPERDQIKLSLEPVKHKLPLAQTSMKEVERLTDWDQQDRLLSEQILTLSLDKNLEDGQHRLYLLLRNCLDYRTVKAVRVKSLAQGKSGAMVFQINVTLKADGRGKKPLRTQDYVLKVSKTEDLWKLESEVSGYLEAGDSELYTTYKAHVPALKTPWLPRSSSEHGPPVREFRYIASSLPWDAIHYDFLGGSLGECMALESALTASPEKIRRLTGKNLNKKFSISGPTSAALRDFRLTFLETLLKALCEIWYHNGAFTDRKEKQIWSKEEVDDRKYLPLPPYHLTERSKRWLSEFLNSEQAEIGSRLFPHEWADCRDRVLRLAHKGTRRSLKALGEKRPVTLSPVHGDLNAGNAFLWLKQDSFPFLIDLPFYQRQGHVLQDFARLEVDLKFSLMDRQEESPPELLPAFDLTPAQVPLWRELEEHLISNRTKEPIEPDWISDGFKDNVSLSYQLVKIIRDRAELAQQQPCGASTEPPVAFMDEYLPALLYHTVRAITYPTLSLFKRLLAVYSAGSILKRIGL